MSNVKSGGGSSANVTDAVTFGGGFVVPSQAASTAASGASKTVSAPNANGLVTLTDATAPFVADVVDHLVYVSAATNAGNKGYFLIVDVPSPTTLTYYNGDAVAEVGSITYNANVKSVPVGWVAFLAFKRHSVLIRKTTDVVFVHAELVSTPNAMSTRDPAIKVDGIPYFTVCPGGHRAFNSAQSFHVQSIISGLSVGTHIIATGLMSDFGYMTYTYPYQFSPAIPNGHCTSRSTSIVTVVYS
jgi:hypothetical protein